MIEVSNSTHRIQEHVATIFQDLIITAYASCAPPACFNFLILMNSSRYWYKVRKNCEYINSANYKTATVNVVKFGLSCLVLFIEMGLVTLFALNYAINSIICVKQQCISGSFIYHIMFSFIWVGELLPFSILNMLCLFMIEVLKTSEVKVSLLSFESWKIFWLHLTMFILCTIGTGNELIANIGVFIMTIFQIYICWITCRRWKLLYQTLKSKCLDYTFEPKNYSFFRAQVKRVKWSFFIIAVPSTAYLTSSAILIMYESISKVIILVTSQQWYISNEMHARIYGNSLYEFIHLLIGQVEQILLLYWALISSLLNYFLLFIFLLKAYRYRRFLAKPIHVKLIDVRNGRAIYKRVNY